MADPSRAELRKQGKARVFLCDLTHTNGTNLSSNVFPLGIGLIASFLLKSDLGEHLEIELFKYPEDLNEKLLGGIIPDILGFSNYSWTQELSAAFASQVKSHHPEVVTVFGGPNYGLSENEISEFWSRFGNYIDFNVVFEGEKAFYRLIKALLLSNFDISSVKNNPSNLKNLHFLDGNGDVIRSDTSSRIDVEELPSPYLDTGLMDKFFDGKLIPLTYSTRGCPFTCTFCSEGADYYNKVKQRSQRIYEEYRSIAQKSVSVGVFDLMLSDANYGMFKEDSARAAQLARVQAELGYPKHVYVSTGKNQKKRVLGTVKKLGGAIQMSASLQSTSTEVLRNIDRSNISIEALSSVAQEALDNRVASYTELILGLPGETVSSHLQSIRDVINAGFVNIRIFQLILLPQTQLNTYETRLKYSLKTLFRPMPRSFGIYDILNKDRFVAEYEEIVIATSSMPCDDYILCRKIGLLVDVIHNGFVFLEFKRFLEHFNLAWAEFLDFIFEKVFRNRIPENIDKLLKEFIDSMSQRLFESRDDLLEALESAVSQDRMTTLTSNELATFKAKLILDKLDLLNNFVSASVREFIRTKGITVPDKLIDCIENYSYQTKAKAFSDFEAKRIRVDLKEVDLKIFLSSIDALSNFEPSANHAEPLDIVLCHDEQQLTDIRNLLHMYGENEDGLSRIVMRSPILNRYFRRIHGILKIAPSVKRQNQHRRTSLTKHS